MPVNAMPLLLSEKSIVAPRPKFTMVCAQRVFVKQALLVLISSRKSQSHNMIMFDIAYSNFG